MILAGIWSSAFSAIKIGVETIPPVTLAASRVLLAVVVLYGYTLARGEKLPPWGRAWGLYFSIAVFGNGLPFTLISWGEVEVDSSLAAILMAIMPLATMVLVHFFTDDEPMTRSKLAGLLAGLTGVVVLVGPEVLQGLGGNAARQLAVALGALCYAIAITTARRLPPSSPTVRAAAVMICATVQMVVFSLVIDRPWSLVPSAGSLTAALYLGLFPTAVATIIYFQVLAVRGANFLATINYLIPVMGVVWGALLLGERITIQHVAALTLILAGVTIANLKFPRQDQR